MPGPASSPGRTGTRAARAVGVVRAAGAAGAVGRVARVLRDDRGQASVETAFGIAALVSVLLAAVSALGAVAMHLAATDFAAQLARAEGRGDREAAAAVRERMGPGWETSVRHDGDLVVAVVNRDLALLDVRAEAAALLEAP